MSLKDFIQEYRKNKRVLFTTPSHSQGGFIVPGSKKMLGERFFECDYSEIEGFDNLSDPNGILKDIQNNAAEIYGAKSAFFLTNGSTSGIIAAMYSILSRNDKVLIARNCHKSVYNGLVLTGAVPVWILPKYNEEWGIYETINLDCLDETLTRNKDIKAFIMTNPTYEGVMSDIYRISAVCKKHNVFLIVDEAHGALWNFHKSLGTPALVQGADIVVQSLHKTAGALNPSSILLVNKDCKIPESRFQEALNLITTTSPSYPILLNIDETINFLNSEKGRLKLLELTKNVNRLIRALKNIPNLEVYQYNNDVTKILIKVVNLSGFELSDLLFSKYKIEDECANEKSVLLLTGIGNEKSKLVKLERALKHLCASNIKITQDETEYKTFKNIEPRVRLTPSIVWGKPFKEISVKYALSLVSMEMICDYPPGIPILLPGEVIKKEHIEYLQDRKTIKVLA